MVCHECGATVEPDQRFCTLCGAVVSGVTGRTEQVDVQAPAPTDQTDELAGDVWGEEDPVWAATGSLSITRTADLPVTQPVTTEPPPAPPPPIAPAAGRDPRPVPLPYDFTADERPPTPTAQMPRLVPRRQRFRVGPVTVIGVLAGALAVVSAYTDVLAITSNVELGPSTEVPTFRTGTWILGDLADNLPIAVLIAAVAMVAGGVAAAFRWPWGAGLAAGGGLAQAGLAALAIGLAELPVEAAHQLAAIPSEEPFRLTITQDLGYWLLLAAGAIGIVLFFAAIGDALGDRRHGLNPWIAALGALAAIVTAAGPMIPLGQAEFADNFFVEGGPGAPPAMLLVARLVQLGLVVIGGVLGFLLVRRWGLGLVAGATLPLIWLAASTLLELGDTPVGPAYLNPGAARMEVHGVTVIGATAVLAITLLAAVAAYDQTVRERG